MSSNSLDPRYSTTRRTVACRNVDRDAVAGASALHEHKLPACEGRLGEGGLRLKGYFKQQSVNGGRSREPLVSVITVVINAVESLEQTILSVINQSYDNVEYIIIDGGSTDGSMDVIRRYEYAIDYWVSEPDSGIYDAWNKGVRLALGEWVAFLGADDRYTDGAIQAYVSVAGQYCDERPEYLSSKVQLMSGSKVVRTVGRNWEWRTFRKYMNVAHAGSFHHASIYKKYGLYDSGYRICGDYELLLRAKQNLHAGYLDRVTVQMQIGGVSLTDPQVFKEAQRAKVNAGGRSRFLCAVERLVAVAKWRLRSWIWRST